MKSQQIKLAYGLGLLNALTHNGVNAAEFAKTAAASEDFQVQKIAHAINFTLKQLNKASNVKTASEDPSYRQFHGVFGAVAPGVKIADFRGHLKSASSNTARQNGAYVGACALHAGTSEMLHGYKFAEEMIEGGEPDGDEEIDPGMGGDGESDPGMGAEGDDMSGDDVLQELQALVDSGEMTEDELAAIMDELTAGAAAEDPGSEA